MYQSDEELEEIEKSSIKHPKKSNVSIMKSLNLFGSQHTIQSNIDPKCMCTFSKRIVRIEYPGLIRNTTEAIRTLGGVHGIQMAVGDHRNKLELHFHPENKFNKSCSADRELNPGILIKVTKTTHSDCLKDKGNTCEPKYDYEIIGFTPLNFKFNRLCDFQYLPLIVNDKADTEQNVEYVYDKILPKKLPTLEWFVTKENVNQLTFYTPTNFARFDSSQNKLYLNTGEKFGSGLRPEISKLMESNKSKKLKHISTKNVTIFVNFQIPNVQIPDQPLTYTMELIKERNLEAQYQTVKKIFEDRPIWTKVAIQYKTGINNDQAKIVLPSVAYFCPIGPWRMTWIRFEYDPQKNVESRIYQTLDYRIRASEGTKLKVNAKRNYANKSLFTLAHNNAQRVSLRGNVGSLKKAAVEERSFILRPNYIPPARQMFYQYCDLLIPEIQEMVSRLPRLSTSTKFDIKNGWLPVNFTEQCREIVNKHVMNQVQKELLEDARKQQKHSEFESFEKEDDKPTSSTYCSKMLSNIKRGIYKNVNVTTFDNTPKSSESADPVNDTINLIDEMGDDEFEQINADDVVNSIPERMEDNSDDEHLSQGSDLEIDMEAVEEVNKMIAGIREDIE